MSVVGHILKGGRGALFRIPANAMQLKGHRSAAKGGSTSRKMERGKKKKKKAGPCEVWCPLKCNYYRTTTPFAITTCSRNGGVVSIQDLEDGWINVDAPTDSVIISGCVFCHFPLQCVCVCRV